MQIRTYDEVDPYQVYRLTMIAFGWPLTPEHVKDSLERDPRVLEGYGIYAVERGKVLSQVVPMRMPVRLSSGVETVGGIVGVCSLPTVWGQGYARRLMERAHEMYKELGLRISALTTSPNIRGYNIYRKMGYVDLASFYRGAKKLPQKRSKPKGVRIRKATRKDLANIQAFYERHVRGQYGWVRRDPALLPMRATRDPKALENYRIVERKGKATGYIRIPPGQSVLASEPVVPREADFNAAIRVLEAAEARAYASLGDASSDRDLNRYRAIGYDLYGPTLGTAMAAPLSSGLRARDLPGLFGGPQGRFVLYPTDGF